MLRKAITVFSFLFTLVELNAQSLPGEKYTSKNGLVSDRITAIAQDEKGFMWFGSYFGICKYDGIQFKKIDLPQQQQNKYVTTLLSANQKIYAGFLFGGGLAECGNGITKSYFVTGNDSSFANEFVCMYDNGDGSILLGNTSRQLYKFHNGSFTFLNNLPVKGGFYPRIIQKDKYNSIWIGSEVGLFILPPPYNQVYSFFTNEKVFSLTKDKEQNMWLVRTNGLTSVVQTTSGFINNQMVDLVTVNNPNNIILTGFNGNHQSGLWLIDINKGLINIRNNDSKRFVVPIDPSTDVSCIFSDRENNIWIANEPGVTKISNFSTETYLFEEMAASGGSISIEDSIIWISNSKALYTISDKELQKVHFQNTIPSYYGILHTDRKKNLWIGFWDEGLIKTRWQNNKVASIENQSHFKKESIKAQTVAEDSKGNLWVGGAKGIFHIKGNKVVDFIQPKSAAGQPVFITCMSLDEASQVLWIGDNATGVIKVKYEQQAGGLFNYKVIDLITTNDGLRDPYIRSILADKKNNLWIGTRFGGIYKVENRDQQKKLIHCSEAANLSCGRISDIVAQDTTAVWFATCDGLYKYQYSNNNWTHLNTSDGLLNAEVFNIKYDPKRACIWALSVQGVTKLNVHAKVHTVHPLVNITAVNISGKSQPFAGMESSPVRYSSGNNSIRIEFAGSSFIDEKKITYKYFLEGHDKEWSQPTFTNNVTYASLPPGKYHFKVMAANARGVWSAGTVGFKFEIVMPLYKRTWFIVLCVALIFLIVYLIRLQQLKQRFKIEKLRLSIAKDLHDDVGATLGSITILSKTATRRLDKKLVTEEMLPIFDKISQSAKDTLDAMDDIVWSINPDKDSYHDLTIRMREFAIPLLEAKDISFSFETVGNNDQPIPMDLRRNAFLIFKESIHNILKHADASQVNIRINVADNFSMEIRDNGTGFQLPLSTQRNGLRNMQSRAKEVKGKVELASSKHGTSIQFNAPLR